MRTIEDLMKSIVNTNEEIKKTMELHNAMIAERDCEVSSLREELAAAKDEVNYLRDALTRNDLEKWKGEEGKRRQEHARLATAVEELLDAMQANQPGDTPTIVFALADTIKHRGMWIVNRDCDNKQRDVKSDQDVSNMGPLQYCPTCQTGFIGSSMFCSKECYEKKKTR